MIPNELKELNQWVCYDLLPDDTRPGKMKKVPICAYSHGMAKSNDNTTWSSYNAALHASAQHSGIGFMFGNGYFGVDIDDAEGEIERYRQGADGIITEFVETLGSYTELSVSGKGIHIICKGKLPAGGRRRGNVEMYESGRFFVMTGNAIGEFAEIADCTEAIKPLHAKYIGTTVNIQPVAAPQPAGLTATEIIQKASEAHNGATFQRLYSGDTSGYKSRSEADMALCNLLAFWCQRDLRLMDEIFRSSGLMRDKWDRRQSGSTYGALTLKKAARECSSVYDPRAKREDDGYRIYIGKKQKVTVHSLDDTGNAERLIEQFGDIICYNYTTKKWMVYNGLQWLTDNGSEVVKMCEVVSDHMRKVELKEFVNIDVEDEISAEKMFMTHVKKTRQRKGISDMMYLAAARVPVKSTDFDTQPYLLNTPSGVINLRTGKLQQHDAALNLSKMSYSDYTEHADCPTWTNFLKSIFAGDTELIDYVHRCVGYTLTGDVSEQCMFVCYGTGRNGKSTFLDILAMLLGEYAVNIQPESLMVKTGNSAGHSSDIARLAGARLAITSESNEGMRFNEGLIKQLTGGDKVTASRKYENEFEFTPQFKLWMMTNHKPRVRDTTLGFWRRLRLIPFTVTIPEDKVDKHLKQKLASELPAIFDWAVRGCLKWQDGGSLDNEPQCMLAAKKEYQTENDTVQRFLDDCTEIDFCASVAARDLYTAYLAWRDRVKERVLLSETAFGRDVSQKIDRKKTKGQHHYIGIKLVKKSLNDIARGS